MKMRNGFLWLLLISMVVFTGAETLANDHFTEQDGVVFKNGVMLNNPASSSATPAQIIPPLTSRAVINAVVVDSQGTDSLSQTIWTELNTNWSTYGPTQVVIDYTTLNMEGITYNDIAATGADILIISCAGPYAHEYTLNEVAAINQYVTEGHGIIITYYSLSKNNSGLADLVGVDPNNTLGTNYFSQGISFDLLDPTHPVFTNINDPYDSGLIYMCTPGAHPMTWPLTTGVMIGSAVAWTGLWKEGAVVKNEGANHRGIYFSHYIEDESAGSNKNDKQAFYNAMLWVDDKEDMLTIDVDTISATTGGQVNFTLNAGAANANRCYLLFGGVSGTAPGTNLPGGENLPINWDMFTNLGIVMVNTAPFAGFMGQLDPSGMETATFDTLGPLSASGFAFYFAYALNNPWDVTSNAVTVNVIP